MPLSIALGAKPFPAQSSRPHNTCNLSTTTTISSTSAFSTLPAPDPDPTLGLIGLIQLLLPMSRHGNVPVIVELCLLFAFGAAFNTPWRQAIPKSSRPHNSKTTISFPPPPPHFQLFPRLIPMQYYLLFIVFRILFRCLVTATATFPLIGLNPVSRTVGTPSNPPGDTPGRLNKQSLT